MKTKLLLLSLALATTSAFAQQTLGSGIDKANMDLIFTAMQLEDG